MEELLSKSGTIGQEAARAIADAAMLEVASTNVPHMVTELTQADLLKQIVMLQQSNTLMSPRLSRLQMTSMKALHLSTFNRLALF